VRSGAALPVRHEPSDGVYTAALHPTYSVQIQRILHKQPHSMPVQVARKADSTSALPAPVRTMARIELERTAADRGETRITVALMEEVKARYFGMASSKK